MFVHIPEQAQVSGADKVSGSMEDLSFVFIGAADNHENCIVELDGSSDR